MRKIDTIHCSAQCILFCGWQCLALTRDGGPGYNGTRNYVSINEGIELAKHNSIINAHFARPKLKNTTYASLYVQNEIINIGENIIKKYLVDKIRSANHFLIMVDEITFNKEVIDLCVQFVNCGIREDFFFW